VRKTLILARREISGYFYSPMAYVIGALFLLASGTWFFHAIFRPGQPASLRPLFESMAYIMVFATPLLTMRLISEEFRLGTFETLVTAPVTDTQVVLGKFLGVLTFYMMLLACTGLYMLLVAVYGRPDPGVAIMGYCGMVLLGAAFLAVGLFASTLTTHQAIAAIVSVSILSFFAILMQLLTLHAPEPWGQLAARLNAMTYFKDFARGMFDSRGVVFFVSTTAMFLFLSVKMLESRRWK
jgi:ABC-2 type transport system permease protein